MKRKYYPTGNEYVSIPTINDKCEIESINYLSIRDRGLIEICGKPFLKLRIIINDEVKIIKNIKWSREEYWIPKFEGDIGELKISGKYITPLERKGFILRLTIKSVSSECSGKIGIEGNFEKVLHSINESKVIEGKKHVYHSEWNKNLMFDFRTGVTMFSFGFLIKDGFDYVDYKESDNNNITFELLKKFNLLAGESKTIDIFCGLGLEEVGAATQAIGFERETADTLEDELLQWLSQRKIVIGDKHLNYIMNLNMFFNYFYASGKTLDAEEMILCTSRSPRYYVSAAYWDRDSLIWSFPAFLMMDIEVAKEALDYVYTKQIRNAGIHSRYIDGSVLEPGFELDELCAFILALDDYIMKIDDKSILKEVHIEKGVKLIYKRLIKEKHKEIDLYKTFLMPTDDMHRYKYLTYNNVLVWKVFGIFEKIFRFYGLEDKALDSKERMKNVKKCIFEHLVIIKDQKKLFAWSGDLNGNHDFYDEPPGSLTMLSYYGFIDSNDEIFRNTYEYLYSEKFPHYFKGSEFEELGCSHADHPWILSICNSMLNGRKEEAYNMMKKTNMDNYIACESVDEYTGESTTGEHFGTCAGFLAYAINKSWRNKNG